MALALLTPALTTRPSPLGYRLRAVKFVRVVRRKQHHASPTLSLTSVSSSVCIRVSVSA